MCIRDRTSIRWLLPRLQDFQKAHPAIRVRLTTDFYPDDGFDPVDTDIGFSITNWPKRSKILKSQTLFPILLTPACAPDFLRERSLLSPEALADCELLHETKTHADWTAWLDKFRLSGVDPTVGQEFSNIDIATKAAVIGAGIVMADLVLCREEFEAGVLVAPFPDMICHSPAGEVCLLGGSEKWDIPKVRAFRSWARDISAVDRAFVQHLLGG